MFFKEVKLLLEQKSIQLKKKYSNSPIEVTLGSHILFLFQLISVHLS